MAMLSITGHQNGQITTNAKDAIGNAGRGSFHIAKPAPTTIKIDGINADRVA